VLGASLVFVYVADRSADWYVATDAEPVRVNTPLPAAKLPVMPPCGVNPSTSSQLA